MWTTEYHKWIKISDDAWVNMRNVAVVERRAASQVGRRGEGIWVHVGGAKIEGTITLEEWRESMSPDSSP